MQLPRTPARIFEPPQGTKGEDGAKEELSLHRLQNPTAGASCDNHWGGNTVSGEKVRSKTAWNGQFVVCTLKGVEVDLLLRIQTKSFPYLKKIKNIEVRPLKCGESVREKAQFVITLVFVSWVPVVPRAHQVACGSQQRCTVRTGKTLADTKLSLRQERQNIKSI